MNDTDKKVVVRIPPSPTGAMHLGTARTSLFNYLFAKQKGGKIILRFEDTDRERSKNEFADDITVGLEWLGITYDEVYKQSERTEIYTKYLEQLITDDHAYISKEKKKDVGSAPSTGSGQAGSPQGEGEVEIVRFRNKGESVTFKDEVRGNITFDTTDLGDFVIAKSMTEPLYHLAVVVDDMEMEVSHVIRGEDHISNTPRQILIQRALGAPQPIYAHIPLILAADKSKLSKRHGAVAVTAYKQEGFLPEAMVNFLALLGWNPGTEQEIFSLEELVKEFSFSKIQKGGAVFNVEKLRWFNKEYLRKLPIANIAYEAKQYLAKYNPSDEMVALIAPIILERIDIYSDIGKQVEEGEFDYYFNKPSLKKEALLWKDTSTDDTQIHLKMVVEKLSALDQWEKDEIKNALWPYAEEVGKGNVLWPLRYSMTGRDKSPDPFTVANILGKEETISRVQAAISLLS
ncbi:glutamate--tRNA ligase [Candidatus Wolfebacteria bacterium]|nr:MAG: glutamate--tRNA ligase [Candidatus Wolfebacteria bacterium]